MPDSNPRQTSPAVPPSERKPSQGNPPWLVPTMLGLMIVGLLWVVVTYIFQTQYPIPQLGNWNLLVGFGLMFAGFALTLRWR